MRHVLLQWVAQAFPTLQGVFTLFMVMMYISSAAWHICIFVAPPRDMPLLAAAAIFCLNTVIWIGGAAAGATLAPFKPGYSKDTVAERFGQSIRV